MRPVGSLLVALVLLTPAAGAWRVEALQPHELAFSPAIERWALAFGHMGLAESKAKHTTRHIAVCALGDVDRDGHPDLLFRIKQGAGKLAFKALAGPDFKRVLWARSSVQGAMLRCAGDIDRDGRADPIIQDPANPASPLPVSGLPIPQTPIPIEVDLEDDPSLIDAVDGETGAPLAEVHANDSSRDATVATVNVGSTSVDDLAPAAPGVLVHVETTTDAGSAPIPLMGQDAGASQPNVTLSLLDANGSVTGTIAPTAPKETIVDYAGAPTPNASEVIVLSAQDASPIDGAPAQTTKTTAYASDGSVVWSSTGSATTDTPVLVPNAGDINGDGVNDTIVELVPSTVDPRPASSVEVLSGTDGSALVTKAADQGSIMALPLGEATTPSSAPTTSGTAETPASANATPSDILLIEQPAPDAPITLACTTSGGQTCWSAQVPASATPVDAAVDPTTGDITGFQDLTGDGKPDVAVVSESGSGAVLQVVDGATGQTAWTAPIPAGSNVTAVPTASGGADLAITSPASGGVGVSTLDGATGHALWSASGASGQSVTSVATSDVNGDGTDDLLVTTQDDGGNASATPSGPSQPLEPTSTTRILDGKTGGPIFTGTTDPTGPAPAPFESTVAPAPAPKNGFLSATTIGIGILLLVAILLVLLVAWRRRRREA